ISVRGRRPIAVHFRIKPAASIIELIRSAVQMHDLIIAIAGIEVSINVPLSENVRSARSDIKYQIRYNLTAESSNCDSFCSRKDVGTAGGVWGTCQYGSGFIGGIRGIEIDLNRAIWVLY